MNQHTFTDKDLAKLAAYIADYLAEENIAETDKWIILDAIDCFVGGAAEITQ